MIIPKVTATARPYQGKIISVEVDTLSRGDGDQFTREVAVVSDSVAIVAMDETDRILLIRQYRHPMKQPVWEIPAGRMDVEGEAPERAALRELREETDMTSGRIRELTVFCNSVGWTTEKTYIFLVSDVCDVPEYERSNEEADIEKQWISIQEALDMVKRGVLDDGKTIIGVLLAAEHARLSHASSV